MSLNLNMSMAVVADVILMQDGLLYGIFHQVYIPDMQRGLSPNGI